MCAVPNMAVCCTSLMYFPCMLLTYFMNNFEMAPFASIITGITFVFKLRVCYISIERSLNLKIFSASFLITFLSPEIAPSINMHVPLSLSRIMTSGLLLGLFCRFEIVDSIKRAPYIHESLRLILVHCRTSFHFFNFTLFCGIR